MATVVAGSCNVFNVLYKDMFAVVSLVGVGEDDVDEPFGLVLVLDDDLLL